MSVEIACLLRMLLSLFLGYLIGFERKMRKKEAGVRTHTIVCVGACLYMLISKFGFEGADTARVAAQIVSGIGFIGAGMIFYHKQAIRGLTTAAGIWATAAIGMACGAGMYLVSVISTILIVLVQYVMHLNLKIFRSKHYVTLNVVFVCKGKDEREIVKGLFGIEHFSKINAKKENDEILYNVSISTDRMFSGEEIYRALADNTFIRSITREDEEW